MEWLGYRRVSRVGGREHLISPELQADRIRAHAASRGIGVRMLAAELDVSGGARSRPILDSAIAAVERGEAAGVIVSDLDRLSRMEMLDALETIARIEAVGGEVIAVAQNFDPTTPEGRLVRNNFLALNAMYREQKAIQIAAAKQRAVRLGIWPAPIVPVGYVRGADRRLRLGPDAPKVRAAFRRRAQGGSWRQVGALLGYGHSGARRVVANRVYLGEVRIGEWVNPAAHRPLLERALWEAAQIAHPAPPRRGGTGWLLGGLVRCAGCQRTMSASEGAYRCLGRAGCDLRARVPIGTLDGAACEIVADLSRRLSVSASESGAERERAEAELQRAEAELSAYQRATAALGDEAAFAAGLGQRLDAVRRAGGELAALGQREIAIPQASLAGHWQGMDVERRRQVLGGLIGVVWVWGRERFRFVGRGFEPDGLSRPGRKGPQPVAIEDADLPGEIRAGG